MTETILFKDESYAIQGAIFEVHREMGRVRPCTAVYLYYFLQSNSELFLALKKEGGVPAVNKADLIKLKIPLPSFNEQARMLLSFPQAGIRNEPRKARKTPKLVWKFVRVFRAFRG